MLAPRFAKALAAIALFNAVLYLCLSGAFASDAEDARKYTEDLKKSKDTKVKITALQELGKLAAVNKTLVETALPDIYNALEDKDTGIRAAAAFAIGQCDEPIDKVVPKLIGLLKDDKEDAVKIGAAKGLASMGAGAKAALPTLKELAGDKKSKVGQAASMAAKAIGGKKN